MSLQQKDYNCRWISGLSGWSRRNKCAPYLKIKNVLHVPKLSTNLISINQLARDLHCNVTFFTMYLFISGQAYKEGDWTC